MKVFILILLLGIGVPDIITEDDKYLSPFRKEMKEKILATYTPCLIEETAKIIEAFDYKVPELSRVPNIMLILETCRPKLKKIGYWMWKQGKDMDTQVLPWANDIEKRFGKSILIEMEKDPK